MKNVVFLLSVLGFITPVFAERVPAPITHYTSDVRYESMAIAYSMKNVSTRAQSPSALQRLQEKTGCDGSGVGPASVGCNFYSTDAKGSGFSQMKLRAGFGAEGVGVGVGMKW